MFKPWWGKCRECGEEQERGCNASRWCTACLSCDNFDEIEEEDQAKDEVQS